MAGHCGIPGPVKHPDTEGRLAPRTTFPRLALICGLACLPAENSGAQSLVEESLRLEAQGTALLLEHYEAEITMLAPDPDRLTVFLTLLPGAPSGLDEATLLLDGKPVARHRYTDAELARLAAGATQPLFVGQLPRGDHQLRIELRTKQGRIPPMSNFSFSKNFNPCFVELQISGDAARQISATSW